MIRVLIRRARGRAGGEGGAVLVLAILFLLIVGVTGGALASLASTNLADTSALGADRTTSYAAEAAVEAGIQNVRSLVTSATAPGYSAGATPNPCPTLPVAVPQGGTAPDQQVQVACAVGTAPLPFERVIVFVACPAAASASSCLTGAGFVPIPGPAAIVVATTLFHDLAAGCSLPTPSSCFVPGTSVDLTGWNVTKATG